MKKRIIALSVAAAMGGFAGSASAAEALISWCSNPRGVGHILLVPYFSTQSANVTAINIVNTDTVRGKVIKVRFRGASNSDDVYDFQVFLSPGDVWTAGISQGADGRAAAGDDRQVLHAAGERQRLVHHWPHGDGGARPRTPKRARATSKC